MTEELSSSPVQTLLSRPDMVKPTSQVQRVEPRKCVQSDGRTEVGGGAVADAAEWVGSEEADRTAEEKEAMELLLLLRPEEEEKAEER